MKSTYGVIFSFAVIFFTGCLMPESTHVEPDYFLLSASPIDANGTLDNDECSFYLREIELPKYLKDSRMIFRPSDHTLVFRESKRWGEPLEDGLARVLALNLHDQLGSPSFSIFPNRRKDGLLWDLSVSFSAFEKVKHRVVIDSKWQAKVKEKTSLSGDFYHETILPPDADEFTEIEAYNLSLQKLARHIATKLSSE